MNFMHIVLVFIDLPNVRRTCVNPTNHEMTEIMFLASCIKIYDSGQI